MRLSRRAGLAATATLVTLIAATPAQAAQSTYRVEDVRTQKQRSAVGRTGAAIVEVDHGSVTVTASRADLRKLRRAGFKVSTTARATASNSICIASGSRGGAPLGGPRKPACSIARP